MFRNEAVHTSNDDLNQNYNDNSALVSEIELDTEASSSSSLPTLANEYHQPPRRPLLKKSKSYGAMPSTSNRSVRFKPDDELIETLTSKTKFDDELERRDRERFVRRRRTLTSLLLLSLVNLLNYTDRYILGSVLIDVEAYFGVNKSVSGLLHSLFLLSFTLAAPLVGYLADRHRQQLVLTRKILVLVSCLVWFASVLGASFVDSNAFVLFLLLRCLFGASSALYECVALPIISDLFKSDETSRRRALFMFYLGPPVGVGVAFLIANTIRDLVPDDWRWSMRFTPALLILLTTLIYFFFHEPERTKSSNRLSPIYPSTTRSAIAQLITNRTYVLIVFASSFAVCTLVGFNWWSPSLISYALVVDHYPPETIFLYKQIHSLVQTVAGSLGTLFPAELLTRFPNDRYPLAPIYLLAAELTASSLSLFVYLLLAATVHPVLDLVFYAVFTFFINSWRILTAGVLLDIVDPSSRSMANSILLFVLHLVGDSLAPYWIGAVNDTCTANTSGVVDSVNKLFYCTQLSIYPLVIVVFVGAALSLFATLTFKKDRI